MVQLGCRALARSATVASESLGTSGGYTHHTKCRGEAKALYHHDISRVDSNDTSSPLNSAGSRKQRVHHLKVNSR